MSAPRFNDVGCQTDSPQQVSVCEGTQTVPPKLLSVGTQLYWGTLRDYHMRSKGLSKKLNKLGQNKDCQVVKKWLRSIKNHIYWSATSSTSGPDKVAKFTSMFNHIQDVHEHENSLFPECTHPKKVTRDPKKWFQPGSVALHRLEKLMNNKRVLKEVENLSHHYQTSALESYHSLLLRFTPKNVVFPFMGMLCRLFLSVMHYNENAEREQATTSTGQPICTVAFPKAKKGQAVAKPVKTYPTYKYVGDLIALVFEEVFPDPAPFLEELQRIPVPKDLASDFDRPSKDEVVARHKSRFSQGAGGSQNTVQSGRHDRMTTLQLRSKYPQHQLTKLR